MIEGLAAAFTDLMTWPGPLYLMLGIVIGFIVGVQPGLGGSSGMALLIPFTFGMESSHALAFLMAVGACSGLGGPVTSILMSVPGDPPNAATCIDGYAMTKQGRAKEALGAATTSSMFGAVVGMVLMLAVLPFARDLVLSFSYPEFFMIAFCGLALISRLTGASVAKGLVAAGLGLLVAFIGLDPIRGNPRFTFDTLYLWDGISLVPPLLGMFAGAEMLALFSHRAQRSLAVDTGGDEATVMDGVRAAFRKWKLVLQSSFIGFGAGMVPGISGTLAAFVAYGQAARSRNLSQPLGTGAVEGVIAPETANDADKGGGLLPTLVFAIPGGVIMAVLLSGLTLHGVPAGPNLVRGNLHIVYVLAIAAVIPRIVGGFMVLLLSTKAEIFTRTRGDILGPVVGVITLIGVYATRNEPWDVFLTLVFAYIGYSMQKYGYSRVTFIIALVLGGLIERSFTQTMQTFGWSGFVTRPIAGVLVAFALLILAGPLVFDRLRDRREAQQDIKESTP